MADDAVPGGTFGVYSGVRISPEEEVDDFSSDTYLTDWLDIKFNTLNAFRVDSGNLECLKSSGAVIVYRGSSRFYGHDQYSQITIGAHSGNSNVGVGVRVGRSSSGYLAIARGAAISAWWITRITNGNNIILASTSVGYANFSSGDRLKLEAAGNLLTMSIDTGGGFSELLTAYDDVHVGGAPAIYGNNVSEAITVKVNSWKGGYRGETLSDSKSVPSNYEISQRSGFRVKPGKLVREWTGSYVRASEYESRHPQELKRAPSESRYPPSRRPEADDSFLSTNEVTTDDL